MSIKVLALTYLISMLHMLFDVLAFKNDIGFFKSRKDFTGLSTRSLATSCCCSLVIFLYLLDNEYTSRIVLFSVGSGTAVEAWKVKRITKGGWVWRYGLPWAVVGAASGSEAQPSLSEGLRLQATKHESDDSGAAGGNERRKFAALADASKSAGEKLTQEIDALGMHLLRAIDIAQMHVHIQNIFDNLQYSACIIHGAGTISPSRSTPLSRCGGCTRCSTIRIRAGGRG